MVQSDMHHLCLQCAHLWQGHGVGACPACDGTRIRSHAELPSLCIAHIDCDSFYATVEKRDNPKLQNVPVIVGTRDGGVVVAACYLARPYGVRSAMPMSQAIKLCPQATIIKPRISVYAQVGQKIRDLFLDTTPQIEPLSIDEAFLDLSGLQTLTGKYPAQLLVELSRRIKDTIGVTVSVGLSANKFLAKTASDLDKPDGFYIIGKTEAEDFLAKRPIDSLYGVGSATAKKIKDMGVNTIGDLRIYDRDYLFKTFGAKGYTLYDFCRGIDNRPVGSSTGRKSVGKEHSFGKRIADRTIMAEHFENTCREVSTALKSKNLMARTVTLKLKTHYKGATTRSVTLKNATNLYYEIHRNLKPIFDKEMNSHQAYILLGISASNLLPYDGIDIPDLFDPNGKDQAQTERLMDSVNEKFNSNLLQKGMDDK